MMEKLKQKKTCATPKTKAVDNHHLHYPSASRVPPPSSSKSYVTNPTSALKTTAQVSHVANSNRTSGLRRTQITNPMSKPQPSPSPSFKHSAGIRNDVSFANPNPLKISSRVPNLSKYGQVSNLKPSARSNKLAVTSPVSFIEELVSKISLKSSNHSSHKAETNVQPVNLAESQSTQESTNNVRQIIQKFDPRPVVKTKLNRENKATKAKENPGSDWNESKFLNQNITTSSLSNASKRLNSLNNYSNNIIDQSSVVRVSHMKDVVANRDIGINHIQRPRSNSKDTSNFMQTNSQVTKEDAELLIVEDNLRDVDSNSSLYESSLPKPRWMIDIENLSSVQPSSRRQWNKVNVQLRSKLQAVENVPQPHGTDSSNIDKDG